jgi:hypothetical protein
MRDLCCGHNAVFLFMMIDVTHTLWKADRNSLWARQSPDWPAAKSK